ncbi:MAG: hypothetical protein II104_03270 [Oscillospiraceae bacterium]|nr:hypothetical protein [Oscillospiraceae bacterium]
MIHHGWTRPRAYIAPKTAGIPYIEEGKTYTFTGTVKEYEGAPEIVVESVK